MWRCYSYGNRAIRIRTRDDKLLVHTKKIFPDEEQFSVYLEKVSYDLNKKSVLEQQIRQMKDSLLAHETYFHKRPAFRHEGEYRLLIADNSLYSAEGKNKTDEEIIEYVTNRICAQRPDWNRKGDNNVRIEDAGDISEFLEGVMVHPLAPQWYVDIIRDICQSKKIKFDGQSEIYTLK